ncbi:hypothetical protein Xvie_03952 [Xenorhabdus vietnamensis]|uniref:Uncharacterized protein n=1 Tax=Xenorhabdus vietnamensis TaxID=351656 RepID=A0A1Y2S682_9GAMM|nr:hypothetical protein [Xenorhabdus vietnamensis]OTA14147.1 hypothetical protein Xvie_03952 [Xenorhabdus vietnamensis]
MNNGFYSRKKKRKKIKFFLVFIFLIIAFWFWYMIWASNIGRHTVLSDSIPEWTTYITFATIIGLILAVRAAYYRPSKHIMESFFCGFSLGFVCIINIYDVCTYLFPGEIIHYESDYKVTFPGPAITRFGSCEAGLWIKDIHTGRWIQLCTNKLDVHNQQNQGMNGVWVTARINKLGSYIIDYKFIFK